MNLSNLKKIKGNNKKSKRLGRGFGSGKGGHTVGRGTKGQNSRSGNSMPFGFEGGQIPLYLKLPSIGGFKSVTRKDITHITIDKLNAFKEGSTVTPKDLVSKKIIKKLPKHGVKILNRGKLEKKLTIEGFLLTSGSKKALEKTGCTIK